MTPQKKIEARIKNIVDLYANEYGDDQAAELLNSLLDDIEAKGVVMQPDRMHDPLADLINKTADAGVFSMWEK